MATIQIRRQLKFAHPQEEALNYIRKRLVMLPGEPLLCTYKNSNGHWGAIEVICVYPKGTFKHNTIIPDDSLFENGMLKENYIKINDDNPEWENI